MTTERSKDDIIGFYEEMLDICVSKEMTDDVDKINNALRNWNAVGAHLISEDSKIDSQLIAAETAYDDFNESIQLRIVRSLKKEFGNSFNATQALIASAASETPDIKVEHDRLRLRKQELKTQKSKIEKIIRLHEGFKMILSTLSSNLRTDFLGGSNSGNNPNPRRQHGAVGEAEAKRLLG